MNHVALRSKYLALFSSEPAGREVLAAIEDRLKVTLPDDLKEIAAFFRGGITGGISHHSLALQGPANNVVTETERLRRTAALPDCFVVLAEPAASLVVLDTRPHADKRVLWVDDVDVGRLTDTSSLRSPDVWGSYADFFHFLLDREAEERSGSGS